MAAFHPLWMAMAIRGRTTSVMSFEFGPSHKGDTVGCWRGLPRWLKIVDLVVVLPAWLFIVYSELTGQKETVNAYCTFAAFTAVTILHITVDHRPGTGH